MPVQWGECCDQKLLLVRGDLDLHIEETFSPCLLPDVLITAHRGPSGLELHICTSRLCLSQPVGLPKVQGRLQRAQPLLSVHDADLNGRSLMLLSLWQAF